MQSSELHPWRVLRSLVLELSSYDVPKVVDRAGLHVDWTLTREQDYSDKMRIAAYRPRIDSAYAELNEAASLRAALVIAGELVQLGQAEKLDSALSAIGWRLDDGKLTPNSQPVRELFFSKESQHDAYIGIRSILQSARVSIDVVDPYADQSTLTLLGSASRPGMSVRLLTFKTPPDLTVEMAKWRSQYSDASLAVRTTREFHDRFMVLDGTACWHIGCSIKDAGSKAFMISQIEDTANRDALLKLLADAWSTGSEVK